MTSKYDYLPEPERQAVDEAVAETLKTEKYASRKCGRKLAYAKPIFAQGGIETGVYDPANPDD